MSDFQVGQTVWFGDDEVVIETITPIGESCWYRVRMVASGVRLVVPSAEIRAKDAVSPQ